MRDELLALMGAMQRALKEKADTIGLDSSLLVAIVSDDIEKKARTSAPD